LIEQVIEGEIVILDKAAGLIHQLNSTASEIWRACDGIRDVDDIAKQIAEQYKIDLQQAKTDVIATIGQLEEQNLVRAV
jgi:hypothetical protein